MSKKVTVSVEPETVVIKRGKREMRLSPREAAALRDDLNNALALVIPQRMECRRTWRYRDYCHHNCRHYLDNPEWLPRYAPTRTASTDA